MTMKNLKITYTVNLSKVIMWRRRSSDRGTLYWHLDGINEPHIQFVLHTI